MKVRRALVSVWDKRGLKGLGSALAGMGVEIVSTGRTASTLEDAGVRVTRVSEVTGFPEILGGRVKTLHPLIHGALLAKRDDGAHARDLEEHGIQPFDLVVVNLYPFEEVVSREGAGADEVVENIDIGGPAMVRAAAKNWKHVAVVVDPDRYGDVVDALRDSGGIPERMRLELAAEAFRRTAAYDALVADFTSRLAGRTPADFPPLTALRLDLILRLRYGENPHQEAAFYAIPGAGGPSVARARQLSGKELSFNNILDADAALRLVVEFDRPTAVAIKHTIPCGAASAGTLLEAYAAAHDADPVSIFGGIVAFNRRLDVETAGEVSKTFLEVVLAPSYAEGAVERLGARKGLRVLEVPDLDGGSTGGLDLRTAGGGMLVQTIDSGPGGRQDWRVVTSRRPSEDEMEDLDFAWRVVKHVKSNAIVVARGRRTLGIAGGQTSRIGAAEIALELAGDASGAVLASDGFFPFPDVVEAAARAGIAAIVQPGGSIRDDESTAAADEAGIAMAFTGTRHFRH